MADNLVAQPSSAFPTQARVVIIGGGVIGCSVAYHLTKLGWRDVILLEKSALTAGTTWHAAGLVVSGTFASETLIEMASYTRDLYTRLGQETGLDTGFQPIGYLELATSQNWLHQLRQVATYARTHGHTVEEIPAAEVKTCGRSSRWTT